MASAPLAGAAALRGVSTWISRQSKNSLEASLPELTERGVHLRLVHVTVDYGRLRWRLPIAAAEYAALVLRLLVSRLDFLLVNPADTWLRRPLALRGVLRVARWRRVAVIARWGNDDWIYRNKTSQRLSPSTFRRVTRAISAAARANLVLTAAQGREVRHWVGFDELDVIGNCKRVPERWLTEPRTPPAGGLVVNVASVQARKGPDLFVRVAHAIVSTTHPEARFVWIGGTATPSVSALIDELDMAGSVEFRPPAHPPYPLLHQASAMFFSSRSEAFGLAVAEAMACGLPVCCFAGTGAAEVMDGCGTVVEMESVAQAADALRAFLDATDPEALSERSRARYRSHFSPEPFADNLAQVLRDRLAR